MRLAKKTTTRRPPAWRRSGTVGREPEGWSHAAGGNPQRRRKAQGYGGRVLGLAGNCPHHFARLRSGAGVKAGPSSRAAHRVGSTVWLGSSSGPSSRKSVFEGDLLPLQGQALLNASSTAGGSSWPACLACGGTRSPRSHPKALGATAARSTLARALGKPRPPLAAPPPPSVCRVQHQASLISPPWVQG